MTKLYCGPYYIVTPVQKTRLEYAPYCTGCKMYKGGSKFCMNCGTESKKETFAYTDWPSIPGLRRMGNKMFPKDLIREDRYDEIDYYAHSPVAHPDVLKAYPYDAPVETGAIAWSED